MIDLKEAREIAKKGRFLDNDMSLWLGGRYPHLTDFIQATITLDNRITELEAQRDELVARVFYLAQKLEAQELTARRKEK